MENQVVNNIEKMFPIIYERQIKMYNKIVPIEELYQYMYRKLEKFPEIIVEYKEIPELKTALSLNEIERAIVVSHKSDVFKTIYIYFRVMNFGSTTTIALYKTSDYRPPERKYYPREEKGCFSSKTVYKKEFNGKWINNTTGREILNGHLINFRYVDGTDLRKGTVWKEKLVTDKSCFSSKERLEKEKDKGYNSIENYIMAREELFVSFFFHCEKVVWESIQKYIEDYE